MTKGIIDIVEEVMCDMQEHSGEGGYGFFMLEGRPFIGVEIRKTLRRWKQMIIYDAKKEERERILDVVKEELVPCLIEYEHLDEPIVTCPRCGESLIEDQCNLTGEISLECNAGDCDWHL